jgi:hypothetical protein
MDMSVTLPGISWPAEIHSLKHIVYHCVGNGNFFLKTTPLNGLCFFIIKQYFIFPDFIDY